MSSGGNSLCIRSIGYASPDYRIEQADALEYVHQHYGEKLTERSFSLLEQFFSHPSIERRRFAIDHPSELFEEDPDARMERFTRSAVDLSARAARSAVERADIGRCDLGAIVVNTCTGYVCPGVSNYLLEELDLSRDIRTYDLVGSGCGGAVPNLEIAGAMSGESATLSVSVEICSATYQMDDDPALLLSNALFADGAAASVVGAGPPGLEIVASRSLHEPRYRDDIRYVYRKGQLHNQLSVTLPAKSARVVGRLVEQFLDDCDLDSRQVSYWALHPGGEKVIGRLGDLIGLSGEQLEPTRRVLREYGNLSSASVWFVLREILRNGMQPGDLCMMVAFGAGLSAHVLLLRRVGDAPVIG